MPLMPEIKVVIAFEFGRLGNQLFEYAAIKAVAPNARILHVGMDSLLQWLQHPPAGGHSLLYRLLIKLLHRLRRERVIALTGRKRLFSLIAEAPVGSQPGEIHIQPGVLPGVAVLDGYFQQQGIPEAVPPACFAIKSTVLAEAKHWLDSQSAIPPEHRYFVHVRRGDYIHWPTQEAPAVLSAAWYNTQISRLLSQDPLAQFFVLTDDLPYSREMFGGLSNLYISKGSVWRDLATMGCCHGGGILSASSLAWWGAFYAYANNPNATLIGPRFWAGWRSGHWHPPTIRTSWIEYVDAW